METIERILQQHVEKTLNEPLSNVSVFQNEEHIADGEGTLHVDSEGKLQIKVSAESIPARINLLSPAGQLIPNEEFLKIEGTIRDGFRLVAERLHGSPSWSIHKNDRFSCSPNKVSLFASATETNSSMTVMLPSFDEDVWNMYGGLDEMEQIFGDRKSIPWLKVETAKVKIGLRKESDSCFKAVVRFNVNEGSDIERYAAAFQSALGFYIGRQVNVLAYAKSTQQRTEIVLVRHRRNATSQFYEPLPRGEDEALGLLFERAIEFFLKPDSDPVLTALHVCWESRKVTFPANYLLVCSAVEGLADYILKDAENELNEQKNLLIDFLAAHQNEKSRLYFGRIKKAIEREDLFKDAEKIRKASNWLKIKVTDEELESWAKLRHRLAHGNFHLDTESRPAIQGELNRAACVANIVNKFILALIGYKGPYCDYSTMEYPTRNFPD